MDLLNHLKGEDSNSSIDMVFGFFLAKIGLLFACLSPRTQLLFSGGSTQVSFLKAGRRESTRSPGVSMVKTLKSSGPNSW